MFWKDCGCSRRAVDVLEGLWMFWKVCGMVVSALAHAICCPKVSPVRKSTTPGVGWRQPRDHSPAGLLRGAARICNWTQHTRASYSASGACLLSRVADWTSSPPSNACPSDIKPTIGLFGSAQSYFLCARPKPLQIAKLLHAITLMRIYNNYAYLHSPHCHPWR